MYDPYDDEGLVEWLENISHARLELEFMNLMRKYVNLKRKHSEYVSNVGWERTARQQERSGGWM